VKTDISTILMATDFLASSRLALDYAASLANKLNAKLVIVNVFELDPEADSVEKVDMIPSRTRRRAEARLQAFVAGCDRAGVSVTPVLAEGSVAEAILDTVNKFKADLLVLGTQGVHRGLKHLLIGSNTESLMLRCPCPTLTIGPHVLSEIGFDSPFKEVIYISNLKPAAACAAPFAFKLSQDLAINIEIHQVVRKTTEGKVEDRIKERLADYCSKLQELRPNVPDEWCMPEFEMEHIISPQTVLEMSHNPSALMVVGASGAPFLERHIHTSYPYRLLANAVCPIITVRNCVDEAQDTKGAEAEETEEIG
jgi:nucleotide-binding universal stress UspA family protein